MPDEIDSIADPNSDFRDALDLPAESEGKALRLEYDTPPAPKPKKPRLTREQLRAKKAFRLPAHIRNLLACMILSTNKSNRLLAREVGISEQRVGVFRRSLIKGILRGAKVEYDKEGRPFWL